MVITLDKEQGKGGLKVIKVEGVREKEREIIVRHETAAPFGLAMTPSDVKYLMRLY